MWNKIQRILDEKGITANKLSKLAGFKNNSTIFALKLGQSKKPSFELMERIADALDVSLDEFREHKK
ncbi:helix-turn-helix domain-containing protein [Pediococcus pentosaceus]|uniref:helix-turn-helix domain-containing protein n=1 Tax=Pediococcus pentosaceus TaxID=1255 RepID=UPI0039E9B3BF